MKIVLFVLIPLILSIGFAPVMSFSEPIDSPRKQMQNGITAKDVLCKSGLILMIRTNGDAICVTPSTAERFVIIQFGTIEANTTDPQEQKQNLLEKIEQINQEIQNIEIVIDGIYQERALLEDEQVKEINETWEMIKYEQQNKTNFELKITNYQTQIHQLSIEIYNLENPDKEQRLPIDLDITDPSLAVYYLLEQEAIEKASNFIQEAEYYFISESDGGKCGLVLFNLPNVSKYVENGVPYYYIYMGHCTHSIINRINGVIGPYVIMDGISGEEIYYSGGFY